MFISRTANKGRRSKLGKSSFNIYTPVLFLKKDAQNVDNTKNDPTNPTACHLILTRASMTGRIKFPDR
jgi:hypothetical protein